MEWNDRYKYESSILCIYDQLIVAIWHEMIKLKKKIINKKNDIIAVYRQM